MVNLTAWLVVGSLIGWGASMVLRRHAQHSPLLNVVVGSTGAALGGWALTPLLTFADARASVQPTNSPDAFSIGALSVSVLGAMSLIAIASLLRRRQVD